MYRNSYQRGLLTILFSGGSKPLGLWDVHIRDGYISRFLDQETKSLILEIGGSNVSTTYISCPKGNVVLGITMPFLVMIVRNLKKYFSFEVTILDETSTRRRFRVSNFQSSTQVLPLCTALPIGLSEGWNQIQFNLAEFTRRAYKKQFVEVQKLKINANIRLRRIYFAEKLLPEDELPPEYKLYFPLPTKGAKDKKTQGTADKENIKPSTSQQLSIKPPASSQTEVKVENGMKIEKPSSKASLHTIKKTPSYTSEKSLKDRITSKEGETVELEQVTEEQAFPEEQPEMEENAETADETQPPEGGSEPDIVPTEDQPVTSEGEPVAETEAQPEMEPTAETPIEPETAEAQAAET